MRQKLLLLLLAVAFPLMGWAADGDQFDVTQGNVTLTFHVISEDARTCMVGKSRIDPDYPDSQIWESALQADGGWDGVVNVPSTVTYNGKEYSVVEIYWSALGQSDIRKVILPESVTIIRQNAFMDADLSEGIALSGNLQVIESNAFAFSNLKSIIIPKSVKAIGIRAEEVNSGQNDDNYPYWAWNPFQNCNQLTSVVIEEGNNIFKIEDGLLIDQQRNILIGGLTSRSSLVIPDGIRIIAGNAFYNQGEIASITIPEGVIRICPAAFSDLDKITAIQLPASLVDLEEAVFRGDQHLTSVNVPAGLTRLSYGIFEGTGLEEFTIPSHIDFVDSRAFFGCNSLSAVTSMSLNPQDVSEEAFLLNTVWNEQTGGETQTYLPKLYVPIGTKSLYESKTGWNKFASIEEKDLLPAGGTFTAETEEGVEVVYTILDNDAKTCQVGYLDGDWEKNAIECDNVVGAVTIPAEIFGYKVVKIGRYAFSRAYNITSLVIPNTVTEIEDYAFQACYALTSFVLPKSVTSVLRSAFNNCYNLSLSVEEGNPVYDSRDGCHAIIETATNKLIVGTEKSTIPVGITEIGEEAFHNNIVIGASITIPSSVTKIGAYAFGGMSRGCIIVERKEPIAIDKSVFHEVNDTQHSKSYLYVPEGAKDAYLAATGWSLFGKDYIIEGLFFRAKTEEGVEVLYKILDDEAKICQVGIGEMGIPAIDRFTTGTLTIPAEVNGYKVTTIATNAITNCYDLTGLTISEGIEAFMDNSIEGNLGIRSFVLPASVTYMSESFGGVSNNLETISVAAGNKVFDSREDCNAIIETATNTIRLGCKTTVIPESVTAIGDWSMCAKNITSFTIPEQITIIGNGALRYNNYTEITIPENVKEIGWCAFDGCRSLEKVTILPTSCNIMYSAFWDDNNLRKVISNIQEPQETRGNIFTSSVDNELARDFILYVPAGTKSLYESTTGWDNIMNIVEAVASEEAVYVPKEDNTVALGDLAEATGDVDIPSTVMIDGEEHIVSEISEGAFENNTEMEKVTIPETIVSIGENAFAGCVNLREIRIFVIIPINLGSAAAGTRGSGASSVFAEVDMETCVLYVPAGSKEMYEEADGWKDFKNIVEMGESVAIKIGSKGKATFTGTVSLDFSYSDKVKAYVATGIDKESGTIWLTRVKDVPAGVPVMIKGEANKTYNVPVTEGKNSCYENMFVGNMSGEAITIAETSDDGTMTNYYMSGGQFVSVKGNAKIGDGKCYLQLPTTLPAAVTGANQPVTIAGTGKSSYAAPVDLDFTNVEGLKAFTATGYDRSSKTIWLTRVMKAQKGEGLLLKGDANQTYNIPSAGVQSAYGNMFVGNTSGESITIYETNDDGSLTNFYLTGGQFKSVTNYATINNNKCYLQLPTEMVSAGASTRGVESGFNVEEPEVISMPIVIKSLTDADGTTGIDEVIKYDRQSDDAFYNLQGQRVDNPGKGLYIKNGKKVVIK